MQSQCRDKEKEDEHDPHVCEEVHSKYTQLFFIQLERLDKPWGVTIPQDQGDKPVEQSEQDANHKTAQKKVSEKNDFFAFHNSSVISDGRTAARLSKPAKSA
jgi:hypothetical protein